LIAVISIVDRQRARRQERARSAVLLRNMTTNYRLLSDVELDREAKRVAHVERQTTVDLLRLLIEVERRGLHLALGHSSLFVYCTRALRLSEQAAYSRITVARAAKRYPRLLDLLEDGAVTLSSVGLLAPHLNEATVDVLLDAARFKSTRDVERMLAGAFPQPDVPAAIRAAPTPLHVSNSEPATVRLLAQPASVEPSVGLSTPQSAPALSTIPGPTRQTIAPISPARFLLKVTLSQDTEQKLQRTRALLRHTIPDGDIDAVLNRALTLLLDQVARTKFGRARKPRSGHVTVAKGRRIPAAVRREVCERDNGRCVFLGSDGPCGETAFLEFHHVIPFAAGGPSTVENLQLRCRAHNGYEAARYFGVDMHVSTRLGGRSSERESGRATR